jgi:hypothetical protein
MSKRDDSIAFRKAVLNAFTAKELDLILQRVRPLHVLGRMTKPHLIDHIAAYRPAWFEALGWIDDKGAE